MRPILLEQHIEVWPARAALVEAEVLRIAGVAAALVAAALLFAGGLLWRERIHSAQARQEPPAVAARVG
jgi:hypothetical protein